MHDKLDLKNIYTKFEFESNNIVLFYFIIIYTSHLVSDNIKK